MTLKDPTPGTNVVFSNKCNVSLTRYNYLVIIAIYVSKNNRECNCCGCILHCSRTSRIRN